MAFVVLAFLAAAVVGIHRADADDAQFLASVLGSTGQVDGRIPADGRSDGHDNTDPLEARGGWFAAVDGRAGKTQDTSRTAVRDDAPTRGAGRKGRQAVRQKSSSRPAAQAAPHRSRNRTGDAPGRPDSLGAVERHADEAVRDVSRRERSDGDRDRHRASRQARRTVERTARWTVETTEGIVREVGELATLD